MLWLPRNFSNIKTLMDTAQISYKSRNNIADTVASYKEKRPRVLIAQNNETAREILNQSFNLYDLEIVEAKSGEAAVKGAVNHQPDLIIMDNELPGLGSLEAMRLIRSINSLSIVPILFLSDCPQKSPHNEAFAAGCDDYLLSPIDSDKLNKLLGKFLFLKGE
jgi:CheY-like chemotaxis protein